MKELEKNDLWTILFISYCASLIKDLPAEDISYQKISERDCRRSVGEKNTSETEVS